MENRSKLPVHVVAAVVVNVKNEVLIAKRPLASHQGGLWEFPGGKLEEQELPEAGLVRELREELGIIVTDSEPFIEIQHDYPDKSVFLDVWRVNAFSGVAYGRENQKIRWVPKSELNRYQFPEANLAILTKLLNIQRD